MKVIIATSNPVKVEDFKKSTFFKYAISIEEAVKQGLMTPIDGDIEENGTTYLQNAVIKAKTVWEHVIDPEKNDIYVVADDSGFEINALNGEPGIYAHRWLGIYERTPEEKLEKAKKILEVMKPHTCRLARMVSVCVLLFPDGVHFVDTEGFADGYIPEEISFDTPVRRSPVAKVLFIPEMNSFFDDIHDMDLERFSYRGKAIRNMASYLLTNKYDVNGRFVFTPTGEIGTEAEM